MAGARSLLARVERLERVRAPTSPFVRAYGSFGAFEQETWDLIAARKLDERDMFDVLAALGRWETDGTWQRAASAGRSG